MLHSCCLISLLMSSLLLLLDMVLMLVMLPTTRNTVVVIGITSVVSSVDGVVDVYCGVVEWGDVDLGVGCVVVCVCVHGITSRGVWLFVYVRSSLLNVVLLPLVLPMMVLVLALIVFTVVSLLFGCICAADGVVDDGISITSGSVTGSGRVVVSVGAGINIFV